METLLSNPTEIVLLIFGLSGWLVVLVMLFGFKDVIKAGFESIPPKFASEQLDRLHKAWKDDANVSNDKYLPLLENLQRVLTILDAQARKDSVIEPSPALIFKSGDPETEALKAAIAATREDADA